MSEFSHSRPEGITSDVERLLVGGFVRAGAWQMVAGVFQRESADTLPAKPGVYAYVVDGRVCYVGSAQRGLRTRLRHYEIAKTLRTVHRVRTEIMNLIADAKHAHKVEIFIFVPEPLYWRGLPIDMVLGVEEGLIRELRPIWNRRGLGGAL